MSKARNFSPRRRSLAAATALSLALLGVAAPAQAQSPRSYAVVSQLAKDIGIVIAQPAIGSRLGNNAVTRNPIPQGLLDKFVLNTTRAVLAQEAQGSRVFLVAPLDTDLFDDLQSVKEGSRVNVPADAAEAFKSQGSTHLIVFSKHRSEASIRFEDGRAGMGSLEGLGFYVDRSIRARDSEAQQTGDGIIAPFMHARATLVELATNRVVRTVEIRDAYALANTRADAASTDVWDALTPTDKVRRMLQLLERHIGPSVKTLVAPG